MDAMGKHVNFRDRLATFADRPNECWLWDGYVGPGGYALLTYEGKKIYAHRLAWLLLVGPIPEGFTVDHVKARGCLHKHCFNPAHLEPVTHRVNLQRAETLGTVNARKTHCPAGHPYSGDNLAVYEGSRVCRTCINARSRANYAAQIQDPEWRKKERDRCREKTRRASAAKRQDPEWAEAERARQREKGRAFRAELRALRAAIRNSHSQPPGAA